jgi:predicted transcriptional regulator
MTDAQTLDGKPCVRFMSDEHPAKNTSAASATEELRSKILEHLDQLRLRVVRPCEQVEDLAKAIKRNAQVVRDEVKRLEKDGLVAPHREGGRRRGVKITEAGVRWLQGPLVSAAA